eukprot:1159189-Pelagomonas_calceolata.AAC.1
MPTCNRSMHKVLGRMLFLYSHAHDVVYAGEYFLTNEQKREQKQMAQNAQQQKRLEDRARQREAAFVAPKCDIKCGCASTSECLFGSVYQRQCIKGRCASRLNACLDQCTTQ